MTKGKIQRVVFTQGTTVTLPQPVGSRSSLDKKMHGVEFKRIPGELWIKSPSMGHWVVVPDAQIKSFDVLLDEEELDSVKRGPGRPVKVDAASH